MPRQMVDQGGSNTETQIAITIVILLTINKASLMR